MSNSNEKEKISLIVQKKKHKTKMYKEDGTFNQDYFFKLLGNDIRRKILSKLSKFPRYASDLAIDLGVSKQAIKKHLDKLLKFGTIELTEDSEDTKKQYYQISSQIALFCSIDLTPNYFSLTTKNSPEILKDGLKSVEHNPKFALTSSTKSRVDFEQLNFSLKALGKQLRNSEEKILKIEEKRQKTLMEKTILLNRIQMIINSLVKNDLEKEVIFSLFFDTKSTIEGLSLNDILNQLFLRKKKRAGISQFKQLKTNEKTLERGQELLKLLQVLIKNFEFIRSDDFKLFFDFAADN